MTKAQIEAFKKITPGSWLTAGHDTQVVLMQENYITMIAEVFGWDAAGEEQRANSIAIAALPDLLAEREKMITMLKEMREACAACFRVLAVTSEQHIDLLDGELMAVGVKDGFGERCQELIAEAEGGE